MRGVGPYVSSSPECVVSAIFITTGGPRCRVNSSWLYLMAPRRVWCTLVFVGYIGDGEGRAIPHPH